MSMCMSPLIDVCDVCNGSLAPVAGFSTHEMLQSCMNCNDAFQVFLDNLWLNHFPLECILLRDKEWENPVCEKNISLS